MVHFFHPANSIFDDPVSKIKFENENRREVISTYLVRFHPYKYVMFYVEFCNALNLGVEFFLLFSPNSGVTLFSLPVPLLLPNFKPV